MQFGIVGMTFGILGFTFGMVALVNAMSALSKVKALRQELAACGVVPAEDDAE